MRICLFFRLPPYERRAGMPSTFSEYRITAVTGQHSLRIPSVFLLVIDLQNTRSPALGDALVYFAHRRHRRLCRC
ncbi:hypothetical protein PUN28_010660 [Cardiocondyla obscurior]|uniref:Uncharacterized protein n=1 Tax=Cardiocondyla obscurior TaxID=286306 RepID=A0AAW2FJJ9_9HYME